MSKIKKKRKNKHNFMMIARAGQIYSTKLKKLIKVTIIPTKLRLNP